MVGKHKAGLLVAAVLAVGALARPALAADPVAGDVDTRQVLALVDQARTGRVTRQEYLNAMDVQYSRLTAGQQGVMNVSDTTPRIKSSSAPHR